MNRFKLSQVLMGVLFITLSGVSCFAVELKVWNEKTKKFETFEMTQELKDKMDRQEALRRGQKTADDSQAVQKPGQTASPPTGRKTPS